MARLGTDIEKKFENNVKAINKTRVRRIISSAIFLILMAILITYLIYTDPLDPIRIVGIIIFFIIFIAWGIFLNSIFKVDFRIKITELLSYYLYSISIKLEEIDFSKPYDTKDLSNVLKDFYNHIEGYFKDYTIPITYYIDFDYNNRVEKNLEKIQIILEKLNTCLTKKETIDENVSINLMKMAQELYKNADFSEEFNKTIEDVLSKLKTIKETGFHINIKSLFLVFKRVPKWILYIISFLIISGLIWTFVPLDIQNKYFAIIMIAIAFFTKYKR